MNIMHNHMISKEKAIGYARVSTDLQAGRDDSLDRQVARIRQAALELGWELLAIHKEVGSAVGRDSLNARPDLNDALRQAVREGAIIMVTEPTRLFRTRQFGLKVLRDSGVRVFSLKDQRVLSQKLLGDAFYAGEKQAEVTRESTSKSKAKSARNVRPSKTATDNSRASRKKKSEDVAEQIADILEEDPARERMTHREFADLLNARGLRSGWGRLWNDQSVRHRRSRAMEILRERRELADEVDVFDPMIAAPAEIKRVEYGSKRESKKSTGARLPVQSDLPSQTTPQSGAANDTEDALRDNPLFGLF